jgi:hypothetical protein
MKTVPATHLLPAQSPGNYPKRLSRSVFDTVLTTALFTSVLFSGLFAGFLTAVLILEASLRRFPASVYTQVRLVELDHLDDLATILLPAALLSTATLVTMTMSRRERVRWLALIALGLLAATFTISLLISVPINTAQQSWSVLAPPSDWAIVRDRWQIAHLIRTTTAVLAFTILAAATTTGRRVTRRYER